MQYAEKIDELDGWQVESTAKTVLQKLGIADYTAKAGTLSGGQQKRLALATALIQPCDLLLLDEPVAGMGQAETEKTARILEEIKDRCAVAVVEHDMNFVKSIADDVTVMHEGAILTEGTANEVMQNKKVQEVYLGRGEEQHA